MSANISQASGDVEMMYVGETPWHGTGTKLDNPATASEALTASRLNWDVELQEMKLLDGRIVKDHKAVIRADTKDQLGVVGSRFHPLQNREAFSLFDAIVGEKLAIYHTAGALGLGEKVWILAKLPGEIKVLKNDVTGKYLLLAHAHDGTLRLSIMFTPIRVVCQNTLNMAMACGIDERYTAKHTKSIGVNISKITQTLGIVNRKYQLFEELSQKLTTVSLTQEAFSNYAKEVMVIKEKEPATRTQNMLDKLSELFESGKGTDIKGVKGTAWGAYNSVVEYVDFYRSSRDTGDIQSNRANSILFGSGATIKQRAWDQALVLVK